MDKIDTRILELKNDGKSLRKIAKQVGISHVAVKKRLDKFTTDETVNPEQKVISTTEPIIDTELKADDTVEVWDTGDNPELNDAFIKIDHLISDIELFIKNKTPHSKRITLETPNGWKIEKIPAAG